MIGKEIWKRGNRRLFDTKHKKINERQAIILLICLVLLISVAGAWFLNAKMNRQYHALSNQIQAAQTPSPTVAPTPSPENEKSVNTITIDYGDPLDTNVPVYDPRLHYFDYTSALIDYEQNANGRKDENGVKLIYLFDEWIYHPVHIAQYGLIQYGNYIETNDEYYLKDAIAQADYLVSQINNSEAKGKLFYSIDNYTVPGTDYVLTAPWSSAMAQGQAISLLSRIYDRTGDKAYLRACQAAMKPLTVDVEDGGLRHEFMGHAFYEEYSTEQPTYVLNGFMFTLFGLYDCWQITGDQQAEKLYQEGIETLKLILPYYDSNGVSLYHLAHTNGTVWHRITTPSIIRHTCGNWQR